MAVQLPLAGTTVKSTTLNQKPRENQLARFSRGNSVFFGVTVVFFYGGTSDFVLPIHRFYQKISFGPSSPQIRPP